ncbi:MAG: xylulose kinase, partial [Chloroflexi bacterium]|nr:xylulose kinase [Chloroflexota bacterium]
GQPHAESRASHELLSPQPNWYEQRAEDWWAALCSVLHGVTAQVDASRIAGISLATQRETVVPVDTGGQALRSAILWMDARSSRQVEQLDRRIGSDAIHALTGKGPSTTQTLPKLVWLREHEPALLDRAYKLAEPHGYLVHKLTGHWFTSLPCADPMGIVDMARGVYAADLLTSLDLDPEQYVDIVPPGAIIGEVSPEAAAATGLRSGTPVIAGSGDGQSAGLGANITGPGRAYLNLGTAVVSGAYSDTYVYNRYFRTLCSPVAGAFVPEAITPGGTFTVSWFVQQFGPHLHGIGLPLTPEELLEAAARKLPPGSLGLMLVPYWRGVMPPYWNPLASGITVGWTGAHRREHFYRALLEGIAYEHRLTMEGVAAATGHPLEEYILMGGGSRSDLWCQIIADIAGKPVARASTSEATNLGAAILVAAAAGWYSDVRSAADAMTSTERRFEPDAATHEVYDALFNQVYKTLYPTLRASLDQLTLLTGAR